MTEVVFSFRHQPSLHLKILLLAATSAQAHAADILIHGTEGQIAMLTIESVHDALIGKLMNADAVVGANRIQLKLGAQLIAALHGSWRNWQRNGWACGASQ